MLTLAVTSAASLAAEPAQVKRCTEGVEQSTESTSARLAQIRYRCVSLRDGQHVLVHEAGASHARTVVLVHGLGNNASLDWIHVMPALAVRFHVIALDLPGFGGSPGPSRRYSFSGLTATLAEVLDVTAPRQRVHVVGHSLGAAVSLSFAHSYPSRVDRLVLVDAAGILLKNVIAKHVISLHMPQTGIVSVDRLINGLDERIERFALNIFSNLDNTFNSRQWLAGNPELHGALLGRHTHMEAALGLVEYDFTSAIRETRAPTTVIWGANDRVAPLRTGKVLAGRMPDARLKVIDGVGHTPMLESPEVFNQLLLEGLTAAQKQQPASQLNGSSQGSVVCEYQQHARYTGVFDSITLRHCGHARIESARLAQLTSISSSVTIENSAVESRDVALSVQYSEVVATNVTFRGRIAVQTEHSDLDLAGVSLRASERAVEVLAPSHILFSVSDWHGTDHNGDAHFKWPP